jgi:hypothetical protein
MLGLDIGGGSGGLMESRRQLLSVILGIRVELIPCIWWGSTTTEEVEAVGHDFMGDDNQARMEMGVIVGSEGAYFYCMVAG